MAEGYEDFMVYELDDSGERVLLDINDIGELGNILHPEQVLVIVREDLRRIYIWKGAKSPVRQRFISSRIAQALQEELVKVAAFHRCKIISVDQGDEVSEFLKAFGLESMKVTEKLADLRYIRNIDRDKLLDQGIIPDTGGGVIKVDKNEEEYISPIQDELELEKDIKLETPKKPAAKAQPRPQFATTIPKPQPVLRTYQPYSSGSSQGSSTAKTTPSMSDKERKEVMEKLLKKKAPESHKRQNLILGNNLYGAVSKSVKVFGKTIEETEWEEVTTVPEEMIEINRLMRIYFDADKGIVEAIEIFEKLEEGDVIEEPKQTTTKKPAPKNETKKEPENPPEKKSAPKTAGKKSPATKEAAKRRPLPKIPKE